MASLYRYIFDNNNDNNDNKRVKTEATHTPAVNSTPCDEAIFVNNNLQEKLMLFLSNQQNENSLVSSFSLCSALGMLLIGLTNETLEQVLTNLSITDKHELFDKLVKLSETLNKTGSVKTSNVVMTKKQAHVHEAYLTRCKNLGEHFTFDQSEIAQLASRVNTLVATNTNGLIKDILSPNDITKDTFLVLLNTIYFKANWARQFGKYFTKSKPFYGVEVNGQEKTTNVQMMRHDERGFKYFENGKLQAISLPYKNNDMTMVFVLPVDKKSGPMILSHEQFYNLLNEMKYQVCNVEIPKFEQETEIDLVPFFKTNHITQMFDYMHADDMIDRHDRQKVSVIKQKCKITVDEEGTEAAAATVIASASACGMPLKPPTVYDFIADHPFSYYIVHQSGLILFSGTYTGN